MFTLVHRTSARIASNSSCVGFASNVRLNHSEGDGKVKEMYIACTRWGLKCTDRPGRKVTIHHLVFNLPQTAFSLRLCSH